MKPTAALAALLLCSACADPASGDAAAAPASAAGSAVFGTPPPRPLTLPQQQQPAPADGFELRLSRGACYGRCPAYRLSIHADGTVEFQDAAHAGVQHGQADAQLLARLRSQLSDPAFALWGSYVRGQPSCGLWATDMPGVSVEAYVDGRWRRIQHDLGCRDAPAGLRRLEQDIDTAAGSGQWTGAGMAR